MGRDCGCVYCTFLWFWCFGGGGVHRGVVQLLPIQCVACRGLAVKGWDHRVLHKLTSSDITVPMKPPRTPLSRSTLDSGATTCLGGLTHLWHMVLSEKNLVPSKKKKKYAPTVLYICSKIQVIYYSKAACIDVGILPPCFPRPMTSPPSVQDRQTKIRLSCSLRHVEVLLYHVLECSSCVELHIKVNTAH